MRGVNANWINLSFTQLKTQLPFSFAEGSTKKFLYRNELRKEMSLLVEEFREAIGQRCTVLAQKHREEKRLMRGLLMRRRTGRPGARDGCD